MIHFLEYQAYIAKDNNSAILSLQKKFFEDWFNVFDLYNFAKVCYCTTTRIPYVSEQFVKDVIGKFYVDAIKVENNMIQLEIVFFYSENKWLDPYNDMLGQVQVRNFDGDSYTTKKDYTLTLLLPIAEIDTTKTEYKELLDYVCDTFTECINQNMSITY